MIVLGQIYEFTKFELARLKKQFDNINFLNIENMESRYIIDELKEYIKKYGPSLLVLNTQTPVDDRIIQFLTKLQFEAKENRFEVISISHFMEKFLYKCHISENDFNLYFLEDITPYTKWQYFQKRCIDYFGLFWLFFFSWPVLIYSHFKIQKQSPGPSLFKQDRIGLSNKEFTCIKFRSMLLDAETSGAQFAKDNDPRVFPWGAFMRKARFDELPQMWNILKGEMHLIGPRPERKVWTSQFETMIPYYAERHLVRPGITGWAQVNYPYGQNIEDARQKLMYDLYYIKHWNIGLELKIVWLTALTVIHKKGL